MTAYLQVFDVEHGACSLLTAANGTRMLIDCGRNPSTGWTPARHLKSIGVGYLDMLLVTNYDEDHVDGLPELLSDIVVGSLWRTQNVGPEDILQLKSEDGMGVGVQSLVAMAEVYCASGTLPIFSGVERSIFFNSRVAFDDENNLSALVKFTIEGVGVLYTGDLERPGIDALLQRPGVRAAVSDVGVLMAPHHGRECSVHEQLLQLARPFWTVISDKGYMYSTQETVPTYRAYSRGGPFRDEMRRVLTTRRDGTINFWFDAGQWGAY